MLIICKYFKRIIIVSDIDTWNVSQWINALFDKLDIVDWKFSKMIIFDKNKKNLSAFWKTLFVRFEVKVLYSIAYYSQFNDVSERTNQIVKIALKSLIFTIDSRNWLILTDSLQRQFNKVTTFIEISSNEICYNFISLTNTNLLKSVESVHSQQVLRIQIKNNISYNQMLIKKYYDNKYKTINLNIETWMLIKSYKNYNIFNTFVLDLKLLQQYIESF